MGILIKPFREVVWPDVVILRPGWTWEDHFNRASITPTGSNTLWSTETGTVAISSATQFIFHGLALTTGGVIGDDAGVSLANMLTWRDIEGIGGITFTIDMALDSAADIEVFIGALDRTVGGITALPTTTRHAGFIFDRSVSANWRRSTADGTTQSVTTSSVAADTNVNTFVFTLNNGNITYSINGVSIGTNSANLPTEDRGYQPYFFVQTEAAAAKVIRVGRLRIDFT